MNTHPHAYGRRDFVFDPARFHDPESRSPLFSLLRMLCPLLVAGVVFGIQTPRSARGDDYVSPPGCSWGILLHTNLYPRAVLEKTGGYVIGGLVRSNPVRTDAAFLTEVDLEGAVLRSAQFTHASPLSAGWNFGAIATAPAVAATAAGYVFTGSVPIQFRDGLKEWVSESLWVVRTDLQFSRLWEFKGDDEPGFELGYQIIGTGIVPNGTNLMVGSRFATDPNVSDSAHLTCLSGTGVLLWSRGGLLSSPDYIPLPGIHDMVAGPGDSLLVGTSRRMAQITAAGDVEWHAGEPFTCLRVIALPSGGSFGVANVSEDPMADFGPRDIALTRLTASGEILWTKTIGLPGGNDLARDLIATPDGGCFIVGMTEMYEHYSERGSTWLIRTDADGNQLWDLALKGIGQVAAPTPDGSFLVAGEAQVDGAWRLWLIKVRPDLQAPVAAFTYSPASPVFIGDPVRFDASGSSAPNSELTQWHWDFGDGSTATGVVAIHTFSLPGRYTVRLTVENADGVVRFLDQTLDARGPLLQWERTYGDYWLDYFYDMVQAEDGGFVLTGAKWRTEYNHWLLWLMKTDARGNIEWERVMKDDEASSARGASIVSARGGGYVIAGEWGTSIHETGPDGWVFKVSDAGDIEWSQRFIGSGNSAERLWSVAAQPLGGGYLITGGMEGFGDTGDVWWGHLAEDGSLVATNLVAMAPGWTVNGISIAATPDGGSLLTSTGPWPFVSPDTPFGISARYFAVAKLDAEGEPQWIDLLGTAYDNSTAAWAAPAAGGQYYAAGRLKNQGCLIRFDAAGDPLWTNIWGSPAQCVIYGAAVSSEDSVLVVGEFDSTERPRLPDLLVAQVDASGTEQWRQVLGGTNTTERGKTLIETSDGALVILGHKELIPGQGRPWLLKLGRNLTPTGRFICTTAEPRCGAPVSFEVREAVDQDGEIVRFEWDFGDGTRGNGSPVSHVFTNAGMFSVTLFVVDEDGGEGRYSEILPVAPAIISLTPGVTVGAHVVLDDPAGHPELVDLEGAPAGIDLESAMAFSLAATGPDGSCTFQITLPHPIPPDALLYKLPEWTVVPYERVDERTILVTLQIVGGELDPWFVLAVPQIRVLGWAWTQADRLGLRFAAQTGYVYGVEASAHLSPANWLSAPFGMTPTEPCTHDAMNGTGNEETLYLQWPAGEQRFYRLRAVREP